MKYRVYGTDAAFTIARPPLDVEAETSDEARRKAEENGMAVQRVEAWKGEEPPPRDGTGRTPPAAKAPSPASETPNPWTASSSSEEKQPRSKVSELGIFAVGLGILTIVLPIYVVAMSFDPRPIPPEAFVLMSLPGAAMVLMGSLLLAVRNAAFVHLTAWVVTLAFVADFLLSFRINPIKFVISGGCVWLVWKTTLQALEELDDIAARVENYE